MKQDAPAARARFDGRSRLLKVEPDAEAQAAPDAHCADVRIASYVAAHGNGHDPELRAKLQEHRLAQRGLASATMAATPLASSLPGSTRNIEFVVQLNQSLYPNDTVTWSEQAFADITGQPVATSWTSYQATL